MDSKHIAYKGGYKYQLAESYQDQIEVYPETDICEGYLGLTTTGVLEIRRGYAWDGPSGPTFDTPSFMRGSLVHDALYQLMRGGQLDRNRWKNEADQTLRRMCRQDGMSAIRAAWVYAGVAWFGYSGTRTAEQDIILYAPTDSPG